MNISYLNTDNLQPLSVGDNINLFTRSTGNIIAGAAVTTTLFNINAKNIQLTGTTNITGNIIVSGNAFIGANTITNPSFVLTGNTGNIAGSNLTFGVASSSGSYSTTAITGDVVIRASGANNLLLQTGQGSAAIKIDSSNNVNVTTQTAGTNNTTVASTAFIATAISNSKPRFYQLYSTVGNAIYTGVGQIPWSTTFTSLGGNLFILVSFSGYSTGGFTSVFYVSIDSINVGNIYFVFCNANTHTTVPTNFIFYSGISAGTHTISLVINSANTSIDVNDRVNMGIIESF